MQIRMVLLEPFLAFLHRAAEFAVLSRRQDPWSACGLALSCCKRKEEQPTRRGGFGGLLKLTSGGRVQTGGVVKFREKSD